MKHFLNVDYNAHDALADVESLQTLLVLAFNTLSDALQDAFDPKQNIYGGSRYLRQAGRHHQLYPRYQ